jgi:hypothetical protein
VDPEPPAPLGSAQPVEDPVGLGAQRDDVALAAGVEAQRARRAALGRRVLAHDARPDHGGRDRPDQARDRQEHDDRDPRDDS